MTNIQDIKNWIKQLRKVKPIQDASIIIRSADGGKTTYITLLETACCVPAIVIPKAIEEITQSDLQEFIPQLNHAH